MTPEEVAAILMQDDPNPLIISKLFEDLKNKLDADKQMSDHIVRMLKLTFFFGVSALLTVQKGLVRKPPDIAFYVMNAVNQEVDEFLSKGHKSV